MDIPITDDGVFERTEYFYADLARSAGSGSVGAPNTTTVFIIEEGESPPSLIYIHVYAGCLCGDNQCTYVNSYIHAYIYVCLYSVVSCALPSVIIQLLYPLWFT